MHVERRPQNNSLNTTSWMDENKQHAHKRTHAAGVVLPLTIPLLMCYVMFVCCEVVTTDASNKMCNCFVSFSCCAFTQHNKQSAVVRVLERQEPHGMQIMDKTERKDTLTLSTTASAQARVLPKQQT